MTALNALNRIETLIKRVNIWWIVSLGFIVRILALIAMPANEFSDSQTYIEAGKQLFQTGHIAINNVMPLYPIITYILRSLTMIKLFDIVLSSITIYIVYKLALEIFKDIKTAFLASLVTAFYPYFIFYSISALTETSYILLLLLAFLLMYKGKMILSYVAFVITILERPTLELLIPILILFFSMVYQKKTLRKSLFNVLTYLMVYVIFMSPWWVHNYTKYDTFVRLNLGDGLTWYAGNNPMNKSGGGVTESEKGADVDYSRFGNIKDPIELNNAMKKAAFDFIKDNPKQFIKLCGLKFVRFWRLWPYAQSYESKKYIIISLLSYGVILLLSLIYICTNIVRDFRKISPIILMTLYFTAAHMVLISSIRYRLPLEPFLIIFAAKQASLVFGGLSNKLKLP